MTPEGTFRILTARSTQLIREAARRTNLTSRAAEPFGRLLTGTALLQIAQSPVDRVQCRILHEGSAGMMVADVWPGSKVRGRVGHPRATQAPLMGDSGTVGVSRQPLMRKALPYESSVPLENGDIGAALQQFVLESEQVLTVFSLATVVNDDEGVVRAGGLIVQALPDWEHDHLAAIVSCMEAADFAALVRAGDDPFDATDAIFKSLGLHHVGNDPLTYQCRCSKATAVSAVLMLSPDELAEVKAGKTESVSCEFCGLTYEVTGDDVVAAEAARS